MSSAVPPTPASAARRRGLRRAIDEMPNEQYQYLLRSPAATIAEVLGDAAPDVPEAELRARRARMLAGYGGHPLIGTPEQITDTLSQLSRTGIDGIVMTESVNRRILRAIVAVAFTST